MDPDVGLAYQGEFDPDDEGTVYSDEAGADYEKVESGEIENFQAPLLAIKYYGLDRNAKLSDLIIAVRNDEQKHSEVNHAYADNYS